MLEIQYRRNSALHKLVSERKTNLPVQSRSLEEKAKLLIVRDLLRLGWTMTFKANKVLIQPPDIYDKQVIKDSMQIKRLESLHANDSWIENNINNARQNLGDGHAVWDSDIEPVVEVCETQEQLDLFRILRFYWSSPYSEYVGRRIKLLIRDNALPTRPVIGIVALGSSIIHIPERDLWIDWSKDQRTRNIIYTMDAYVLGALPPYNYLLGGKLISYIVASSEIRQIFQCKYKDKVTLISGRTSNKLACIFTTSLYGNSSQYNRLKYGSKHLFIPIGHTKGYGTLHLTNETFDAMRELLQSRNIYVTNRFGDGPIWRMRVIRTASEIMGFDANFLLKHSFKREIYAVPLAHNFREFLKEEHVRLRYYNYSFDELVGFWKERWLNKRKRNLEVMKNVYNFKASNFRIN